MSGQSTNFKLPPLQEDTRFVISKEGLNYLNTHFDPSQPQKNVLWTTNYRVELPIRVRASGSGSQAPQTLIDMFKRSVDRFGPLPALTYEQTPGKWVSYSYNEYDQSCCNFGKACIAVGLSDYSPVMIIGFNAPQWIIAFYGSMFARYLPIGMYTTYSPQSCEYVANHSKGEMVVVENEAQLRKYYGIIEKCKHIRYFVVYKGEIPSQLPGGMKGKVFGWREFMKKGQSFTATKEEDHLQYRMKIQKPGNCATFIYTSGTTGMPKAVMASHDSCSWNTRLFIKTLWKNPDEVAGKIRMLSYLPMSHVACQFYDFMTGLAIGANVFFPDATVLTTNIIKFLRISRPSWFVAVPRVWEKIQQYISANILKSSNYQRMLTDWAMGIGIQGTFDEINGRSTPAMWSVAKRFVFNRIKSQIGLDQCTLAYTTAAPIKEATRKFFYEINIQLASLYGMSQTAAPFVVSRLDAFKEFTPEFLGEIGFAMQGLDLSINRPDSQGKGQICMRGRTNFMGYYGNEQSTKKAISKQGFVMSGDEGTMNAEGCLFMTGRIKELLITAGGENVAPVPIENEIVTALPILSQAVVIGDKRKFLSVLVCLKEEEPGILSKQVVKVLEAQGSATKTVTESMDCPVVSKLIMRGIDQANKKALSNAHTVKKFTILPTNFTVDSGLVTPTMKLKRNVIASTFQKQIDRMYIEAKI